NEKWNKVNALKALLDRDYSKAIKHLKKIESKENIKNLIIDCYWEEIDNAKKDIKHLRNAFNLAYYGNLTEEEDKNYIIYPAGKLFEHCVSMPNATDSDYQEATVFAEFTKSDDKKNVLARKFLYLIEENNVSLAVKLKKLYNIDFSEGGYEEGEKVVEIFERLTETKGIYKIPKGEENLHTALDMALIFDFGKGTVKMINGLLCRFYLSEGKYEQAKMYFVSDDKLIIDLIVNLISEFVDEKRYNRIYELLDNIKLTFPYDIIRDKRSEITDILSDKDYTLDNFAKMVVIEDVFELNILPKYVYNKIFLYCSEVGVEGAGILVDLSIPLIRKADSLMKVRIYRIINAFKVKDDELSKKLEEIYKEILPPTLLDWIIYFLKILFINY
ncbi:hypothetical protein ACFL4Z_02170, partial [candidate division KSB1 bacterium]